MRLPLLLATAAALCYAKHHRHRVPVIELSGAEKLVATVREDERILNTVPALGITSESGPVCSYRFTTKDKTAFKIFEADVIDRYTGAAIIRITDAAQLDCKKAEYDLEVVAVKCDEESVVSEPVNLHVTVRDTNNHEPVFEHPWYTVAIDEGKIHNEIVRVAASDADCGHPYGEICEYSITNGLEKIPFEINKQGVIRNTVVLNSTSAHSYILTVVATDCGMRKSKSALVTINVKEACVEGVSGAEERLNFDSLHPAPLALLPKAAVSVCPDENKCKVTGVTANVALHLSHLDEGCGSRTGAVYTNETIKACGLSDKASVILEDEETFGDVGSEEKRLFDGETRAHIVPVNTFDGMVPQKFALSFSMKHDRGTVEEQNNKQHILCESDDAGMNRHHFSVYVRHCKLEVVLRREAGAAAEFRAAEWRWNTPEVCDNKWHSYSLLFADIDDVSLVIDGTPFKQDERNPEILDDWPLHKAKSVKTRMVVGACWHGRSLTLAQFFKGSLANIRLLAGATETKEAIACAHSCPERLTSMDETASFNSEKTSVKLTAKTVEELQTKLRGVTYENILREPQPGHRPVAVSTSVECEEGKTITLPETKFFVMVEKAVTATLSISGQAIVTADQKALRVGTTMIPGLKITVSETSAEGETVDVTADRKLDSCKVHLKPSRDMDLEYFSSPATLIASTKIDFEHDKQGILLRGEEWAAEYQEVLQKIHYFNTRPDAYAKRIYSVQCTMDKGRVVSNEFIVTMSIDPSEAIPMLTLDSSEERHYEPAFDQFGGSRLQNILEMELPRPKALMQHHGYDMGQGAVAGGAVAVVVVVCVGFLLVLLVVGVLKMRDTPMPNNRRHKRSRRSQPDGMEWDDAGMNITVNPLDDVEKNVAGGHVNFTDEESSDGEDSECSYHEEDEEMSEEEDEEDTEILPVNHQAPPLEWDDEDAGGAAAHPPANGTRSPSARSYRV